MTDPGKRDGMARVRRNADPYWWQRMSECARLVAERKQYFNSDDIVLLCRELYPDATTHDKRAIGPLMAAAQKLGYCVPTQDTVESRQKVCHSRPMRVWWSLIYRGPARRQPKKRRILDPRQIPLSLAD